MPASAPLPDDECLRAFISSGHAAVHVDLPPSTHGEIHRQIDALFKSRGNPGNDILPEVPALREVLEHPAVRGLLSSVLGPDYILHPHRHCHHNPAGSPGQRMHQDSYEDDENVRHHRPRWAMAFYYPQEVDAERGPSAVLPATQYYDDEKEALAPAEKLLCGPAGTLTVVHYDLWHRAAPNQSAAGRYMVKFLFCRMCEPRAEDRAPWQPEAQNPPANLCRNVWDWYAGRESAPDADARDLAELQDQLRAESQQQRLRAAYALGGRGEEGICALLDGLRLEAAARLQANMQRAHTNPGQFDASYGLVAAGRRAVPALVPLLESEQWWLRAAAADMLGDIGERAAEALPALARALSDESEWVRRNAAEALGAIGAAPPEAVDALARALADPWHRVRHNAALALARLGPGAAGAVPALRRAREDENYYARHLAPIALERIGA